eukprot:GHVS01092752.1.p1 GENE.GHVS01092752.1~~GHVS01092752.1.p1  ORF type:complete len:423 (-),score=85.86 GHVS01092752.1:73-1311(-)
MTSFSSYSSHLDSAGNASSRSGGEETCVKELGGECSRESIQIEEEVKQEGSGQRRKARGGLKRKTFHKCGKGESRSSWNNQAVGPQLTTPSRSRLPSTIRTVTSPPCNTRYISDHRVPPSHVVSSLSTRPLKHPPSSIAVSPDLSSFRTFSSSCKSVSHSRSTPSAPPPRHTAERLSAMAPPRRPSRPSTVPSSACRTTGTSKTSSSRCKRNVATRKLSSLASPLGPKSDEHILSTADNTPDHVDHKGGAEGGREGGTLPPLFMLASVLSHDSSLSSFSDASSSTSSLSPATKSTSVRSAADLLEENQRLWTEFHTADKALRSCEYKYQRLLLVLHSLVVHLHDNRNSDTPTGEANTSPCSSPPSPLLLSAPVIQRSIRHNQMTKVQLFILYLQNQLTQLVAAAAQKDDKMQ